MEKTQQKYIYVCFLATNTTIAKISRKISKCDYTHISISFNESLEDFVSFSRKCTNTPLDAGIVWERRGDYIQPGEAAFRTKIFRIPVSEEKLLSIKKLIWKYERDSEYMFNILSMVTMTVFHGFSIYKTENHKTRDITFMQKSVMNVRIILTLLYRMIFKQEKRKR